MLGWIPIIGPIIQGLFNTASSIYGKFKDTQVDLRKQEVTEAQISANIIESTKDDIGLRLSRDIICFPISIWCALVSWDTIVALRYPDLMFHVAGFDKTSVPYLPYAVLTFLLGNIGINMWNRK